MITRRGFFLGLLFMLGLPTLAQGVHSAEIEQPAGLREAIPREQPKSSGSSSVGVREVPRADGGRDVIYYSGTPLEEKQARQQAEAQKQEKSLETLREMIIIKH